MTIANDANCFALSEAIDGAGAEASLVFGAILGTGVGGGIVVDRQVLVDRPDRTGRVQILKVHVRKVKLDPTVNLDDIAALSHEIQTRTEQVMRDVIRYCWRAA